MDADSHLKAAQSIGHPTLSMQESMQELSQSSNQKREARGRWTATEHEAFINSLRLYGKDWYRVEEAIGTRSSAQIRSHAQKFLSKLDKEPELQEEYQDIKQILDVNLRLLKKSEKEPNEFGRMKHHGGAGRKGNDANGDEILTQADIAYQMYKQEYTLLPTQRLFKIEKLTDYERDELLKKWELDKQLQIRRDSTINED